MSERENMSYKRPGGSLSGDTLHNYPVQTDLERRYRVKIGKRRWEDAELEMSEG